MSRPRKPNPDEALPWWVLPTLAAITAGGIGALAAVATSRRQSPAPSPSPALPSPTATPSSRSYVTVPTSPSPSPLSGFAASLAGLSSADYLRAVELAILGGLVPAAQVWRPVHTQVGTMTGTFFAQALPLCCGTDASIFHPALPVTVAQRIADRLGAMLPTRRMVDLIHAQASAHVAFEPYTADRSSVATFLASSRGIEARRAGRTGLVSDYGKDYVLSNQRRANERRITIYGAWETPTGSPVQPFATPHGLTYYDYSQHARLVRQDAIVNGRTVALADALANPATAALFSSEGVIAGAMLRYPQA